MNKTAYAATKARLAIGVQPTFEEVQYWERMGWNFQINAQSNNRASDGWIDTTREMLPKDIEVFHFRLK